MTQTDIPNHFAEKIPAPSPKTELQTKTVVEVFLEAEQPYLTRRQVENKIEDKVGRKFDSSTYTRRLGKMADDDIIISKEHSLGHIYWLNWPETKWPKPPDVDVQPTADETTLTEFLNRSPVKVVGIGFLTVSFSTILIWIGGSLSAFGASIPFITVNQIIVIALICILVGWGIVISGLIAYFNRYLIE